MGPLSVQGPPLRCAGALSVPSSRFLKICQDSPIFPFWTSTRSRLEALAPRPPLFFVFVFPLPPAPLKSPVLTHIERSKTLRPGHATNASNDA